MTRARLSLWAFLVLAGGLGVGCKQSGTFAVLTFQAGSPAPQGVKSIALQLTLGAKTTTTTFTGAGGGDITLPTSATLEIDSGTGTLTVLARALDGSGALLATGSGQGTIATGSTTPITIVLGPGNDGDGGVSDGAGGASGGGGSGGAAGASGGADGGTDASDAGTDGGAAAAKLVVDNGESKYDFGTQVTTATGAGIGSTVVTIRNAGGQLSGALMVGVGDAVTFPATGDTCTGATLAPGATCAITLKFEPATSGMKSSTLTVSATPGGMTTVMLTGMAVDPGALSVTPDHMMFDPLQQGQVGAETLFTIKNTGGTTTTTLTAVLTGTSAGELKLSTDGCSGMTLAGAATCMVGVKFAPTTSGTMGVESAVLSVSATTGGTATANLSGTALGPAAISIVPTDQDFLMIVQGSTSPEYTFMVTNKGDVATGVLVTGISPTGEFAITTDTCNGQTLAAGAPCKVGVKMTPNGTGARNASLNVRATPGGNAVATLRGTGLAPGMLTLSPQPGVFGTVDVGGTPGDVPFKATNTGGAATSAVTLSLTGSASLSLKNDTCTNMTVAAGGNCTFDVVFTPAAYGPASGNISATATTGGTSATTLSGTGRDYVTLTATKAGAGNGTVAATGLTCVGATCTGSYPRTDPTAFQSVTLTASPDALSTFTGWSGACTGTGSCVVTMSAAEAVTATFGVKQVLVSIKTLGVSGQSGSVASADGSISCMAASCGPTAHNAATTVTLVATPALGSTFSAWSNGPCKGTNATCVVPLTSDLSVTAVFGPQTYMFVTSATIIAGRLGGVAGADTECATLATAAGLPGTYKAWISDTGVDANTRVGTGGWVRTDGLPFTGSLANLKAFNQVVYYPPRVDENGNDLGTARISVLTGGNTNGTSFGVQCTDYTQTTGSAYVGFANAGSEYWSYQELSSTGCQDQLHLYCFRSDTTATVTMPVTTPARHIFISDLAVSPLGGLTASADAECIADAHAAGLLNSAGYVGFLATSTKTAISRLTTATTPFKRPDEVIVANGVSDLGAGNLISPIDVAANGSTYKTPSVWTGAVDAMTVGDATCTDWTSAANGVKGRYGYPNAALVPDWFNSGTTSCDTANMYVICVEP